uniref:ATP synthase complex subunit 8 n=1 Tax=Breviceps poweri TaxID=2304177 RepID=A0A7I6P7Z5_9NEOB|nr:ATPase subunit 8 [Breviceps poweri]
MPQLILDPWLFIFTSSWLIFLLLFPTKILTNITPNNITSSTRTKLHPSWTWPWL